jgi:energy-coupling factor transporter transmembrane protein EcfT
MKYWRGVNAVFAAGWTAVYVIGFMSFGVIVNLTGAWLALFVFALLLLASWLTLWMLERKRRSFWWVLFVVVPFGWIALLFLGTIAPGQRADIHTCIHCGKTSVSFNTTSGMYECLNGVCGAFGVELGTMTIPNVDSDLEPPSGV